MIKLKHLILAGSVFLSASIFAKNQTSNSEKIVLTMCQAIQGNGYNWGASLGWLSETFKLRASLAKTISTRSGKVVLFDLNCSAGSSSGTAVNGVYIALLGNKKLVEAKDGLYTIEDVVTLSKALKVMAYNTDMPFLEVQEYLSVSKHEPQKGKWWSGHYPVQTVLNTFTRRSLIASRLTKQDVETALLDEKTAEMLNFAKRSDIPLDEDSENFKTAEKLTRIERDKARQIGTDVLGGYTRKNLDSVDQEVVDYLLNSEVPEGLMAATYGHLVVANGHDEVVTSHVKKSPPSFNHLRPVLFMSLDTLNTIIKSREYQQTILDGSDQFLSKTVFVGVDNLYDFIKPSITEPLLFGVDFKLLSAHGSMEYFDPKLAIQNKEKFSLRAVKFDTSKLGGTSFNQYFINVGGWLHYAAFKRVLGYYQIAKQQKYEGKSNPGKRFIYLNSFGRHGASTRFSPMLINDYFTRNQDGTQPGYVSSSSPYANFHKQRLRHGAADNIATYYYGLYDFENVFKRKLETSETINLKSTHVGYNWDVTQNKILGLMRLPGAMLRHSRRLLMLSINHTRSQLDINIESEADHVLCRLNFGSSCEPAKVGNSFGWTFDSQKDRNYYQTAPWPNWLFEKLQNKASSYKN